MRSLEIYRNGVFAGILTEESRKSYIFRYDDTYFSDDSKAAISLTLPKNLQEHKSEFLFPFFVNMLSEGINKKIQTTQLKIDEDDYFSLLKLTANFDTIGAITTKVISQE